MAKQLQLRRGTTQANDLFTGANGEVTVDTTTHELRVHDGFHQGGFKIGGGSGSGRNIGDIFYTTRTDTALAGAVECNGGTYNTADYTGTGSIGELLRAGKLPYVSLADYATLLSTNGSVGVFGWNGGSSTIVKVPTLRNVFIECGQVFELGEYIPASIPNLKCSIGESSKYRNDGCLNVIDDGNGFAQTLGNASLDSSDGGSASMPYGFSLNASRVSSVYKDSAITVQPDAIIYRAMVQLFNSTTDEAVATVGTVVAQVGELRNMSNITATGKETVVGWGMPDYSAGVTVSALPFTAPTDGILYIALYITSDYYKLYVNGNQVGYGGGSNNDRNTITVLLSKNDVVTKDSKGSVSDGNFYPLKGAQNA